MNEPIKLQLFKLDVTSSSPCKQKQGLQKGPVQLQLKKKHTRFCCEPNDLLKLTREERKGEGGGGGEA